MPSNSLEVAQWVVVVAGTYLLHSTILLAGAWLVMRMGRVRSHVLTERLWKMAAVLGLVTAPIQVALGWSSPIFDVTLGHGEDTRYATSDAGNSVSDGLFDFVPAVGNRNVELQRPDTISLGPETIDENELAADFHRNEDEYPGDTQEAALSSDASAHLPEDPSNDRPSALAGAINVNFSHNYGSEESLQKGRVHTQPRRPDCAVSQLTIARFVFSGAISIAGFVVCGWFMLVVQTSHFYRRCTGSRVIGDGPARRILDRLRQKNSIRRRVRLLSSDAFDEPVAFGLVRWTIVLPTGMEQRLGKDELKALLAHELAHLVRGDVRWLWIGRVLCSCLAFQPLNFLARRRWQHAAEFLCDDWAVGRGGSAISLARCLTRIAEWRLEQRECAASLAAGGSRAKIVLRVERLVNATGRVDVWTRPYRGVLLRVLVVVTAACLVCTAPRVVFPARVDVSHSRDAQPSFLESDNPGTGVRAPAIESDRDWRLFEEELLQLERDSSYAFKLLTQTSHEPEVHESAERMHRHVLALHQRRQTLAERMKKELDR